MNIEEKLVHWKGCISTRLNSMRQLCSAGPNDTLSSKQIVDLWPMYKEPGGFRLVINIRSWLRG